MSTESDRTEVTVEEYEALRHAVRVQHENHAKKNPGSLVMRGFCVCGYPSMPGPLACQAFSKLLIDE